MWYISLNTFERSYLQASLNTRKKLTGSRIVTIIKQPYGFATKCKFEVYFMVRAVSMH